MAGKFNTFKQKKENEVKDIQINIIQDGQATSKSKMGKSSSYDTEKDFQPKQLQIVGE